MAAGYIDLSGGGRALCGDASGHDVSGGAQWIFCLASSDWDGSEQVLARKWSGGGNNRCWSIRLQSGRVFVAWSPDGTSGNEVNDATGNALQTDIGALDDDDIFWLRVTLDFNDGGAWSVTYDYSFDPAETDPGSVSWTESEVNAGGSTTSIHNGSVGIDLGAYNNDSSSIDGLLYYFEMRELGGSIRANPDFRSDDQGDWDSPPVTDDASNSWSLSGTTSYTAETGNVVDYDTPPGSLILSSGISDLDTFTAVGIESPGVLIFGAKAPTIAHAVDYDVPPGGLILTGKPPQVDADTEIVVDYEPPPGVLILSAKPATLELVSTAFEGYAPQSLPAWMRRNRSRRVRGWQRPPSYR